MRRQSWIPLAVAVTALTAGAAGAAELDGGLITAVDRIGGNLLGPNAFDAVGFDAQPDPPRLRLFLSEKQTHPVEIILVTAPGESEPPEPVRAYFRLTAGGLEGLKLEFDSKAGEIVPCIVPPDLGALALAPEDNVKTNPALRAGLVTALGEVGKNLLGAGKIDAVLFDPQPDPPRVRIFLSKEQASLVEIVLTAAPGEQNPPDPMRPFFRMVVGGEEVTLEHDRDAGGRAMPAIEPADLSDLDPPDPI